VYVCMFVCLYVCIYIYAHKIPNQELLAKERKDDKLSSRVTECVCICIYVSMCVYIYIYAQFQRKSHGEGAEDRKIQLPCKKHCMDDVHL
jgi:hypothetical protein